ncbi:hypothetical protein [Streptomyces griseoluteus]|uniref:hypothetical protein n=1 Tax=Streptomyces griseoluteus TaxID=29306 RepID=UPI0036FC4438
MWKAALLAVDEDWNSEWPTEWQGHYAALRQLVRDEEGPAKVLPGFTVHGRQPDALRRRRPSPSARSTLLAPARRARSEVLQDGLH